MTLFWINGLLNKESLFSIVVFLQNRPITAVLHSHIIKNKSLTGIIMHIFKRRLIPVAVSAAMALSFSGQVLANSTSGSIYGTEKAGTEITYVNKNTGAKRTLTVAENGKFRFSNVQPGVYTVTNSDGESRTIQVSISQGTVVNFDNVEVVRVLGNRLKQIDVTNSESSTVFTLDSLNLLPVSRDIVNVALLTPGTNQGGDNFGRNLPSFGGASIAENGYYIDGFDVTDLRELLGFATLPFEAVSQVEVKRGGLKAEYGRSLGGITNTITRSGTNEWEVDASVYYRPNSLRASRTNSLDFTSGSPEINTFRSEDEIDNLDYSVTVAGPIIEDKLFIMANISGQKYEFNNYAFNTSRRTEIDSPAYVAKIDWNITDNHRLGATYINNEEEEDITDFTNIGDEVNIGRHGEASEPFVRTNGGDIFIANYTGYLTDQLSLRVMYGQLESAIDQVPLLEGGDCPRAFDTTGGRTFGQRLTIGCWNPSQSLIDDPTVARRDERVGWRSDIEYTLDNHLIRAGYEIQEYDSYDPGRIWTGGVYYRYFDAHPNFSNIVNGVELPEGTVVVRTRTTESESGNFSLENTAWYLEDTWNFNETMQLYIGLRGETFKNLDANGKVFLESDSLIAPRFGFTWDVNGDSSAKLYSTLGRYYIPVATNTNIRATRIEQSSEYFNIVTGWDPATGAPIGLGEQVGSGFDDIQIPNPETIADTELSPMFQDELIVGYEQQISEDWTVGIKGMFRTIKDGMDDYCGTQPFIDWAADNGHTNFDPHSLSGCILVNPGRDVSLAIDLNNDGNLSVNSIPASYFELPQYKRDYYALELTAEKAFADNWNMNFSYVFSRSYGNAEGYVNSTLAQEDAGITQDFDHPLFVAGSNGPLPNDKTHQIKVFGTYELNDEVRLGMNVSAVSGIPLSCNGFLPPSLLPDPPEGISPSDTTYDRANFSRYGASSFFCSDENGDPVLTNRGDEGRAPWTITMDVNVNYSPEFVDGLTIGARVFNLLNANKGTAFNQVGDQARGNPNRNPNFLQPTVFQTPRRVELFARYTF